MKRLEEISAFFYGKFFLRCGVNTVSVILPLKLRINRKARIHATNKFEFLSNQKK